MRPQEFGIGLKLFLAVYFLIIQINVSSFTKGNYFVEIMTNQGKVTKTIIIQ
ncbi:T9SS type A sorting domain-containing protein [Flavobacterium psychrophilum]|uniref:T9SS type A sorting domain-containing protein n=1 Tax=Flavobacterium psychrophilum TaxID=96345 RepID=UPI001EE69395|nr:T9SS type A sorting domain-containing protein [Flavobacterium psychrophilum]